MTTTKNNTGKVDPPSSSTHAQTLNVYYVVVVVYVSFFNVDSIELLHKNPFVTLQDKANSGQPLLDLKKLGSLISFHSE